MLLRRDHSLQSLRIPYLRNLIICGSSVLIFSSLSCSSDLSLRLETDFLFVGRASFSREDTRDDPFPSSSLIEERWKGLKLLLSLIHLIAFTFSTDSVAKQKFWYTATAFLLIGLAFLGLKVTLEGLKSLWINPSGSNTSIESDTMNVLKARQKCESAKLKKISCRGN